MSREDFETVDGSRPEAVPLGAAAGRRLPLSAFAVLSGGDAFEVVNGRPPAEGPARARVYLDERVTFSLHRAPAALVERVRGDMARQLAGNLQLIARLSEARPLHVELIPAGQPLTRFGFPAAVSRNANGLFWDQPSWDRARMALRQDRLEVTPHLVFHEMAHAIHALAFTAEERELIYRTMLRTYRSHAAVDEVFAIYSEREFVPQLNNDDLRAPGVYGMARARWNEGHVFTRFVRNLYFPYRPLAGPR